MPAYTYAQAPPPSVFMHVDTHHTTPHVRLHTHTHTIPHTWSFAALLHWNLFHRISQEMLKCWFVSSVEIGVLSQGWLCWELKEEEVKGGGITAEWILYGWAGQFLALPQTPGNCSKGVAMDHKYPVSFWLLYSREPPPTPAPGILFSSFSQVPFYISSVSPNMGSLTIPLSFQLRGPGSITSRRRLLRWWQPGLTGMWWVWPCLVHQRFCFVEGNPDTEMRRTEQNWLAEIVFSLLGDSYVLWILP